MDKKMFVVKTNKGGHYAYFNFQKFLKNLNEESDFRDDFPALRTELGYCTQTCRIELHQFVMLMSMDIGT